MIVWVLIVTISMNHAGGPLVIDNIATAADCHRIAAAMREHIGTSVEDTLCLAVRKAEVKR